MNVQYLSDAQGRHTAIVIPIEDWNSITAKHQDLKTLEALKRKPSDFFGTLSHEEGEKMQEHVTQSRNEWDRGI
ncbi:hypothetical protein [Spirosoma pollinicola]|uniref:Prevent-host-death protein n=1 Tax=Spirosoma pollinicola TaxID=2057025 RepID=A0A2K8Z1E6_9BACT|nr:hypothetical protein [Spirosoma pollinicola]AUD03720.1 hypothetical protein CWM47_18935 [Spirosoma pollinicola]